MATDSFSTFLETRERLRSERGGDASSEGEPAALIRGFSIPIRLGLYPEGGSFPHEEEVVAGTGAARSDVQSAYSSLRLEGMIEDRQGDLIVVDPPRLSPRDKSKLQTDLESLLDQRANAESRAASLAALNRVAEDLTTMDRAVQALEHARSPQLDIKLWRAADNAFHVAVARASKDNLLEEQIVVLRASLFGVVDAVFRRTDRVQDSVTEHARVLGAIRDQLADRAGDLMRKHIESTRLAVHRLLGWGDQSPSTDDEYKGAKPNSFSKKRSTSSRRA